MARTVYALLVGINDYPAPFPLAGCLNDVEGVEAYLREWVDARSGSRVDGVRLRYHSPAIGCAVDSRPPGTYASLEIELDEPAYGVAPGQTACLLDGDLVVGRATIAS